MLLDLLKTILKALWKLFLICLYLLIKFISVLSTELSIIIKGFI